jgi:hypothetical protein
MLFNLEEMKKTKNFVSPRKLEAGILLVLGV